MKLTKITSDKLKQELSDLFLTSDFNINIIFPDNYKGSTILEVKYKEVQNDEQNLSNKTFCTVLYPSFQKSVEQTALDIYNDIDNLYKRQKQTPTSKYSKALLSGLIGFVNNNEISY